MEEIQRMDALIAYDIGQIADRAGLKLTEDILLVCYRAMNRAEERGRKERQRRRTIRKEQS